MNSTADSIATTPEAIITSSIVGFVHHLRERRFAIGVREDLDCHTLAEKVGITNKQQLKLGLKTLLCQSAEDWGRFDDLFDDYWQPVKRLQNAVSTIGGKAPRSKSLSEGNNSTGVDSQFDANQLDPSAKNTDADNKKVSYAAASSQTSLANKHFKQLDNASELRRAHELCERLARSIRKHLLRRQQKSTLGRQVDFRRTLRNSLCYGGIPLSLSYRQRRQQTPKLVLLLDVSRSMSVYSYLFLRFAHGILSAFKQANAFAFHAQLINITDVLRESNRHKLVEKMHLISQGFGGGTCIGESLTTFNQRYAPKILNSRTTVIILSDGYDTGEPDKLVEELKRIKRRARRLLWLNPLLGQESYEPSTRCMQAVLPLLDVFAPAHNLASLASLEHQLA
jgi:uncharacterized protein with von Willebrand factor type A (vWA) domain